MKHVWIDFWTNYFSRSLPPAVPNSSTHCPRNQPGSYRRHARVLSRGGEIGDAPGANDGSANFSSIRSLPSVRVGLYCDVALHLG